MKKFLLPSTLLLSVMSFAQIDFSSTRFGVSAGANLSAVKNAHNPSGRRLTVQAGVLALIPVGNLQAIDKLLWLYYSNGEYSVKSGYKVARLVSMGAN